MDQVRMEGKGSTTYFTHSADTKHTHTHSRQHQHHPSSVRSAASGANANWMMLLEMCVFCSHPSCRARFVLLREKGGGAGGSTGRGVKRQHRQVPSAPPTTTQQPREMTPPQNLTGLFFFSFPVDAGREIGTERGVAESCPVSMCHLVIGRHPPHTHTHTVDPTLLAVRVSRWGGRQDATGFMDGCGEGAPLFGSCHLPLHTLSSATAPFVYSDSRSRTSCLLSADSVWDRSFFFVFFKHLLVLSELRSGYEQATGLPMAVFKGRKEVTHLLEYLLCQRGSYSLITSSLSPSLPPSFLCSSVFSPLLGRGRRGGYISFVIKEEKRGRAWGE